MGERIDLPLLRHEHRHLVGAYIERDDTLWPVLGQGRFGKQRNEDKTTSQDQFSPNVLNIVLAGVCPYVCDLCTHPVSIPFTHSRSEVPREAEVDGSARCPIIFPRRVRGIKDIKD